MTTWRASAFNAGALIDPRARTRLSMVAVQQLQRMQQARPSHVRLSAAIGEWLTRRPTEVQHSALTVQVLRVQNLDEIPDNGLPFQWHTPDRADETGRKWLAPLDRSTALVSWSAAYGRTDAVSKAGPVTVTLQLTARHAPPPELGELFRVAVSADLAGTTGRDRVRFSGEVTDVVTDPAGDEGRGLHAVTAVGKLARQGRRTVDARGFGVNLDGARVARLIAAAGVQLGAVDAGSRALVAPDAPGPLAAQLDAVVDSAGGLVVEQRTGEVDYHDADHRYGAEVVLELDASEVVGGQGAFTWAKRVADVVNVVEVAWAGGTVTASDPDSVDAVEAYPMQLTTLLATAGDAYDVGSTIVGRRATPTWQLPTVTVDLLRLVPDPTKRAQLLQLRTGDRIKLTGLPAGGPYTSAELFVEGTTEAAQLTPGVVLDAEARTRWLLSLVVSDPALSGVDLRWVDVPDATTWTTAPDLSWLQLARVTDPAALNPAP